MKKAKRKRLEAKGWKLGTTAEFLKMSTKEDEYVRSLVQNKTALNLTKINYIYKVK